MRKATLAAADAWAAEIEAAKPLPLQPGEMTVATFKERAGISQCAAEHALNQMVANGRATCEMAVRSVHGQRRQVKVYRKV